MALGIAVMLFAFCWLRVWIVGFLPMQNFETILKQFPQIEQFLPVSISEMITYNGRIALVFNELIVVVGISVWAITRGSDVVSGELARGTMEMVLAQPVSRRAVFWTKTSTGLIGLLLLVMACWLGIYFGIKNTTVPKVLPIVGIGPAAALMIDPPTIRAPLSAEVSSLTFLSATFNLFSLGVFLTGVTTALSSLDRYRWRTIGMASALFAVSLVIKIVAIATPQYSWLRWLTFLNAYEPQRVVQIAAERPEQLWLFWIADAPANATHLGPLGMNSLLLGLGVVGLMVASEIFARRDLPAPY